MRAPEQVDDLTDQIASGLESRWAGGGYLPAAARAALVALDDLGPAGADLSDASNRRAAEHALVFAIEPWYGQDPSYARDVIETVRGFDADDSTACAALTGPVRS